MPATCFGTHVREEFMGRLFITIYRTTTHISGLQNSHFTSLTHFCSLGWASSFMNIWKKVQANQSAGIPVEVLAGLAIWWLGTVPTYLYSSFLLFYFFIAARCFSPTKELNAMATITTMALESKFHEIDFLIFFWINFPEEADGRPCWHGFFQLVWYQKLRAWGLRTLVNSVSERYHIYSTTYLPAFENLIWVHENVNSTWILQGSRCSHFPGRPLDLGVQGWWRWPDLCPGRTGG